MSNNLIIFTKKVLPRSLTFVADQGLHFPTLNPIFAGFREDPGGLYLLKNAKTCLLENYTNTPQLSKFILEGFSKPNLKWISALKRHEPALLHAHFGKGGYYSSPIAKKLDIPLAVTFHGSDITQKSSFSYNQRHKSRVFDQANAIFAVSKFIHKKLLQSGCPSNKVHQHYIGIDTAFFQSSGRKAEVPTIAFVGRLIKQKGCHLVIKTFEELQKFIPDLQLFIAGYGPEKKRLQQQASHLRHIYFLGSVDKLGVKKLLDKSWVLCAPSTRTIRGNEEGLGMVFLESQAMGVPVVSFDTGGISEAVANGSTGILVKNMSIDALTFAVKELLSDDLMRSSFEQAGIIRVKKHFDIKVQTASLELLLKAIC